MDKHDSCETKRKKWNRIHRKKENKSMEASNQSISLVTILVMCPNQANLSSVQLS